MDYSPWSLKELNVTEGLIKGDRKRERGREAQGLRTGTDKELNPKQTMSHDSLSTCQQVHALPLLCDSGMHLRFVHSGHFGRGEEAPFSTRSLPYSTLARKLPRWLGDKSSWQWQGTQVRSLAWEAPLEEEMATYCNILARRIPWTEKSSGLQSTGLQRVRHNLATERTHSRTCLPHTLDNGATTPSTTLSPVPITTTKVNIF